MSEVIMSESEKGERDLLENPPAFPREGKLYGYPYAMGTGTFETIINPQEGMTMHNYFAAAALQGLIAHQDAERVVSVFHCTADGFSAYPDAESQPRALGRRDTSPEVGRGRPLSVLLPEFRVPRSRRPGRRKPLRLRPLRQGRLDPLPPLPLLRRSVLRAQGHPAVPLAPAQGEGHRRPGARRRGVRRPPDRAARRASTATR